jgi:hypothetical protein
MTWWKILYAPEIAIPLMVLLILLLFIAPYIGWKIKGGIDNARIKDMEAQIDAANNRLLLTKEQRAAGADVESGLQMLRKRLAELDMRFKAGAKRDELATRLDIVAQTVAKLTSVNDVLQRTFVQTEATKKAG